jgi:hypothetical protein
MMRSDMDEAAKAAMAADQAGFPVYVVGIGPNLDNLMMVANMGGGYDDYFPASSAQQLSNDFATISRFSGSCTFVSANPPPDVNNLALYLDKKLIAKDDPYGWSFGRDTQTFVLNTESCKKLKAGAATTVTALFGCPGPAPPLMLP